MDQRKLDLTDLTVDSFTTAASAVGSNTTDPDFCCTGCDSGCGIYYTAGCTASGTSTTDGIHCLYELDATG
jgi:hypothetical protein